MVCPAEPNSSVSLNVVKLKRSLCGSHRWNRVASVPFKQYVVWDMRRIQRHQKRPACRFYVLENIPIRIYYSKYIVLYTYIY